VKLNKGEFGPEAFSLHLKNENFEVLSDVNYATHLLGRSSSVEFLHVLLEPMKKLFNAKDYGFPYNVMASQQQEQLPESAGGTATHEHGGASSPNSNNNDVGSDAAHASSVVKIEVKEEEPSTDDEAGLFDAIEESFVI